LASGRRICLFLKGMDFVPREMFIQQDGAQLYAACTGLDIFNNQVPRSSTLVDLEQWSWPP
jgi:hypothetical protein